MFVEQKKSDDKSYDIGVQLLLIRLEIKHQLRYACWTKRNLVMSLLI